ncbi:MAG: PAS domain-containing sensor histidine kinase [Kiloniellales bacterium]
MAVSRDQPRSIVGKGKRAEEMLRESGKRTRAILDNVADCVVVSDDKGRIEAFNPAAERTFGYTAEEVLGRNVRVLMLEPDRGRHGGYIRNYLKTGKGNVLGVGPRAVTGRRKDGSTVPIEFAVSEMFLGGKRMFIATMRDITERIRLEKKLAESEARLRAVVDHSPTKIHIKDLDSRYLLINRRSELLFGVTEDQAKGKTTDEIFPKDIAKSFKAHDRKVVKTGQAIQEEETWRQDDGIHTYLTVKFPIPDAGGDTVAVGAIGTDITARKEAEQALSRSEERFRDFAELASDWFWEMDENLRFTYFSEEWTPGRRINLKNLLGKTRAELAMPDDDPAFWQSHLDTLAAHKPFRGFTYPRLDDHGRKVHMRVSGTPIFNADGTFVGYRGTAADVTAEVEAVQALRAARDEAQLANTAMSEFLANMSHELRTPLNAIVGFSEVMKHQTLGALGNARYLEYTKDIHDAGNHLLDLINDILDLSKVESGKDELHEEVLEIGVLLDSVYKLVSGRAERASVALEFDVARELPALRADERKLKQILVNLLSNAIKFTGAGGQVTFRAWYGGGGMVFQVADTGIGIVAENIPIALAPFRQVEDGFARKYQGTGLGLPLAKSLAEMHGGSLDLQSEPGVGTTVTVRLPAARAIHADSVAKKRVGFAIVS